MKKIKRLFSNVKNSADTSSLRGSLGKRNSSLSSVAGHPLHYDIKPKELDKIHKAVINQDEKKVELLAPKYVNTRDKGDRTPLHLACAVGNVAIVEKLLSWKALINVPDRENKTPLFKAIECGHEDCAKLLIQTKVGLTVYDKDGNSSLHHLCIHGMSDLVPLVLDKLTVADAEKKNKFGQNPLHLAIEKSNANIVEMLLKKGVNANTYNQNNITPLMMACYRGHKEVVLLLLKYKADPALKDSNGNTAADLAMKMGHEECAKEIEFFDERDEETDATKDDNQPMAEGDSNRAVQMTRESDETWKEDKDVSWDESESETNDFYKGKSNFMLSKILKDNKERSGQLQGDNHGVASTSVNKNINEKPLKDYDNDDDDDDDDDADKENDSLVSSSPARKGKGIISPLKNQTSFDDTVYITSNTEGISNVNAGSSNGNILQTFEDEDGSCWDSENEDIPSSAQREKQQQDVTYGNQLGNAFTLSEIKYPILTEKFQPLSSQSLKSEEHESHSTPPPKPERQSKEDSFHDSSDEDPAPIPKFEQASRGRRSSSIENQIGSFVKNESKEILRISPLKKEKPLKKSFDEDWDSLSEISSKGSEHRLEQDSRRQSSVRGPRPIIKSSTPKTSHVATNTDGDAVEDAAKSNTEIKILKEEISNLKNMATMKDAELENLTRKLKILEDENAKLEPRTSGNIADDVMSQKVGNLKEEIKLLQSKLNQIMNERNELKELNVDLRNKMNAGNKSLEQVTKNHEIEVLSLKNKLHETNSRLDEGSQKDAELQMTRKNFEEKLKHQMEACKEHELQLAEQKSKLMKLEIDNDSLKMSLDGRKERCMELEKEVTRLTLQHENVIKDLLSEKDKSIKMNFKAEEKIRDLERELENMQGIKQLTSSEVFLKAEQDQKVALLEGLSEDLKHSMTKLREELDLQRKKHESECKSLTVNKNELFNKLVLAESSLKKESMSKQFLENEVEQLNRELEKLKQKLSEEQSQRQTAELKMISTNQLMEASKSSSINIESKLSQKAESLVNMERENESLKESLHMLELENMKTLAKFKMEEQLRERLQEELTEMKNKLSDSLRESYEQLKTKKQLQEKVQNLTGSKDLAVIEAENQRELWENEIKTKSKLGLRLYQLDHENRGILTKLTQEQMKLKKALERNQFLNEELKLEKQKCNMLSQKMEEFINNSNTHSKNKVKYNHSRYLVDATKKSKTNNDENRNVGIDLKREAERIKKEIEQKTHAEFMEKLQQVYQFLEEQAVIRSQNEQKRMENLELLKKNLLDTNGQSTVSLHKGFSFSEKPSKVQSLFNELKISENKLRDHLHFVGESPISNTFANIYSTPKAYTTDDILQQLERSIKSYNSTI